MTELYKKVLEIIASKIEKDALIEFYVTFGDKLKEVIINNDADALKKVIGEIEDRFDIDLSEAKNLFFDMSNKDVHTYDKVFRIDTSLIIERLVNDAISTLNKSNGNNLLVRVKSDVVLSWEDLKKVSRQVFNETGKCVFYVPSCQTFKGQIVAALFPYKISVTLATVCEIVQDGLPVHLLLFVDDHIRKSTARRVHDFTIDVYAYLFVGDDNKEYVILTPEELPQTNAIIKGVSFTLSEKKAVGEYSKLPSKTPLILLSDYKDLLETPTEEEYLKMTKDITCFEDLAKRLRGELKLPEWYERLIFAWLFSGKWQGYPLHLFICGPGGTLKSTFADAVANTFNETVASGTSTTLVGLIPSFKTSPPSPGHLVMSKRIAMVDEFFKMVTREKRHAREGLVTHLASLNELLDHRSRTYTSGSGSLHNLSMSAKAMFITNPIHKYQNMLDVFQELEDTFISRFLVVWHDRSFVKYVENLKDELRKIPQAPDRFMIRLHDFMNERLVKIDTQRVKEIYEELKNKVPDVAIDQYTMRYFHHIYLLIDGIAKLNAFLRHEIPEEATDEDYEEARQIMERIILGWKDIELADVPVKLRRHYLDYTSSVLLQMIEKVPGVTEQELRKLLKYDITNDLQTLIRNELVKEKDGRYYPYWYTRLDSVMQKASEKVPKEEPSEEEREEPPQFGSDTLEHKILETLKQNGGEMDTDMLMFELNIRNEEELGRFEDAMKNLEEHGLIFRPKPDKVMLV